MALPKPINLAVDGTVVQLAAGEYDVPAHVIASCRWWLSAHDAHMVNREIDPMAPSMSAVILAN
jgi:hypothetical protein